MVNKPKDNAAASDQEHTLEGQSFYNAALTGSGNITEDGVLGPPTPDPTLVRGLGPGRTSGGRRTLTSLLGEETGEASATDKEAAPATTGVSRKPADK